MPRINRKVRVRPQNQVTRAQIIELLIGPNGKSVFASEKRTDEQAREAALALWSEVQQKYSPDFASKWHIAGSKSRVLCPMCTHSVWVDPGQRCPQCSASLDAAAVGEARVPRPFAEIAEQYARQVVTGEIEACKWTRLACKRHLDDLARAAAGDWKYRFDIAKAERACRFLELLPHTKGRWAANAELMFLQPWQVFIVCVLFGWVKASDGMRRFSLAYIEIPRKNGKSQLAAGIGLYLFACDAEFGAEVYSGATNEKQAHEVFRPAVQMIQRSPELAQALGVLPAAKKISKPEDGSRFEVVVGKPGDGASPHCGIVDEYHEHDSDTLFDTFRTGMGARSQPLLFVITTAGDNAAGPCKMLQGDVCRILERKVGYEREEVFGIIYSIDEGDSWTAVESLPKSNPNLDVSVSREFLIGEVQAAILNPRKQGIVQTKHFNLWVGTLTGYFDVEAFKKLANPALRMNQFIGLPAVVSEDLSTKRDFTFRAITFRKRQNGKDHYYVFVRCYLPQAQVDRKDAPHYKEWADAGWIRVHSGATVDFDEIEEQTIEDIKAVQASEFAFDPWNAASLGQAVGKRTKATPVEIPQNVKYVSPMMKELDAAIADGRVHHEGNPVLEWMIGNVMAREDANENVLPRKEVGREDNKIDGAVAVMMGVGRAKYAGPQTIAYTGLRSVG